MFIFFGWYNLVVPGAGSSISIVINSVLLMVFSFLLKLKAMEMLFLGFKLIAAGLATISLTGAGAGIGVVFAGFLGALARNPREENKLFSYALLGFALTEAIALFGSMIVFLILFGF